MKRSPAKIRYICRCCFINYIRIWRLWLLNHVNGYIITLRRKNAHSPAFPDSRQLLSCRRWPRDEREWTFARGMHRSKWSSWLRKGKNTALKIRGFFFLNSRLSLLFRNYWMHCSYFRARSAFRKKSLWRPLLGPTLSGGSQCEMHS